MIHQPIPEQSAGYSSHLSSIALLLFLILAIADVVIFRFGQDSSALKSMNYFIRLAVSSFATIYIIFHLTQLQTFSRILAPTFAFVLMVVAWFFSWSITEGSPLSWLVILTNPSYSIFAWLFILWIAMAGVHGIGERILGFCSEYFGWGLVGTLVVATLIRENFAVNLYLPTLAVLVLFGAIAPGSSQRHGIAFTLFSPFIVAACMGIADHRTYMLAALLAWPIQIFFWRVTLGRIALSVLCIAALPFMYAQLVSSETLEIFLGSSSLTVDTRTFLFQEVWDDLSTSELTFGRGLDGTYYSQYFYLLTKQEDNLSADYYFRSGSEVGWINILIKFGFIGLVFFLVQIITALGVASYRAVFLKHGLAATRFIVLMFFIFSIELPASITAPYLLWYVAIDYIMLAPHSIALVEKVPRSPCINR